MPYLARSLRYVVLVVDPFFDTIHGFLFDNSMRPAFSRHVFGKNLFSWLTKTNPSNPEDERSRGI